MFGAGRYSIPRPVTRNLEDLDSVQSVLLHRSVPGTGSGRCGGGRLPEIASRAAARRRDSELPFCGGGTRARGRVLPPCARPGMRREGKGRGALGLPSLFPGQGEVVQVRGATGLRPGLFHVQRNVLILFGMD